MRLSDLQIDYCMECGVCTGSCPVAMELQGFSPRQMIKRTISEPREDLLDSKDIWACLSCSRCSDRCPVEIDFPAFIRSYRKKARGRGNLPALSHHGMFDTLTRIQARGGRQNRTAWAGDSAQIAQTGEYYYFSGCVAYYDVAFQYLDLKMIEAAKNHLKILNRMGIVPAMSDEECCCGHDAFWCGDDELFVSLAKKNLDAIRATGAKTVIFGCPEGYSMFKEAYPEKLGDLPFEIVHISEFLAQQLPQTDMAFKAETPQVVTFQDPCRLGRRSGIYDAPRELIRMVEGTTLAEMEHNRENAVCCGTTGWMECSTCSKVMQIQRLKEAEAVGAEAIITSCPKCQIHLTCAKKNTDHKIDIIDLATYLAANIDQEQ